MIAGDQNSDPLDGDSVPGAIQQLIDHQRIEDPLPTSEGAPEAAALQGGANLTHESDPRYDTADFADSTPGNLRADYVLPAKRLKVVGAGVFWPVLNDPLSRLTGVFPSRPPTTGRCGWTCGSGSPAQPPAAARRARVAPRARRRARAGEQLLGPVPQRGQRPA